MKTSHGIYKITNTKNNKVYIGSSHILKSRKYQHFKQLELNKHINTHLQASYNKHGKENFKWEVIEYVEHNEDKEILKKNLLEREQHYLDLYYGERCYNILPTAGSTLGHPVSEETRKKIGDANRGENNFWFGKSFSEETKNKMSISAKNKSEDIKRRTSETLKGHKVSEETKKKISEKQKGKFISQETREKLRVSHLGYKVKEETKNKISEGNKNKIVSEETKRKIGEAKKGNKYNLGRKLSEETKRKIGEANRINMTGKKFSEETKEKMKEAHKRRKLEREE